jgi:hypothetical protein
MICVLSLACDFVHAWGMFYGKVLSQKKGHLSFNFLLPGYRWRRQKKRQKD